MEGSLYNVADIPNAARSAIEGLVGHALANDDVLYIAALGSSVAPAAERDAAWDEVESIIVQTQRSAAGSGLTTDQIDALLDAECDAVRSRHRT